MMKTKKSRTDGGDLESGKDNDTAKSKQNNSVKRTKINSSPSRSNTAFENTVISTISDVKKRKARNSSKVVTDNLESDLNKEKVFYDNSSEIKKKRTHDVSASTSSVPVKKSKKESSKTKEKLQALAKKRWMKIEKIMKKKKAAKKLLKAEGEEDKEVGVSAQIAASLEYLRQWKNDKGNWSFQKVRQVWLLRNMYNKKMVPEEDFAILLEYLEGLQGAARKMTVEKAEKIMKDGDDTDNVETGKKSAFSEEQLHRVRQVLQLL